MDRLAFANLVLDRLRLTHPDRAFLFDEDDYVIVQATSDGHRSSIALAPHFEAYTPDAQEPQLERIVQLSRDADARASVDEVRSALLPRVRPRRYYAFDVARGGSTPAVHHVPFAEHLGVGLAIERSRTLADVADPSRYDVALPELQEIALANLRKKTTGRFKRMQDNILLGSWGDELAAERMLLPELWDGLALAGDPVAFLPAADTLLVAGSRDEKALSVALVQVARRRAEPRSLLGFAFVREKGTWKLFEPLGPVGDVLGHALSVHLGDSYVLQKQTLEAAHAGAADAPSIASLSAGKNTETGDVALTYTTWTAGARSFLPRADRVIVSRRRDDDPMVPWTDLIELAGDLMKPVPEMYPPRWEVKTFPDAARLTKLRTRAKGPNVPVF